MFKILVALITLFPLTISRTDAQMSRVRPPVKNSCESMPIVGRTLGELCSSGYDDTLRYWNGSAWVIIGMGDSVFSGAPPADYVVFDSDGTYQAMNARTLVVESESTDAGEVIGEAIRGLGSVGGTVLVLPGTYNYTNGNNAPLFYANRSGWTRVIGQQAILHLSTASPRAFLIDPDATGILRNIEISGFEVDAEDAGTNTGPGILFSDRKVDNSTIEDISYDQIYIHDIDIYGVYADYAYLARDGIQLVPTHRAASGTTSNETVTNITIERMRMYGFNNGIQILMHEGYNYPSNVVFDNIVVRDVSIESSVWDGKPQTHFRFGGKGIMGTVILDNLVASNSGDNNLEVNNALNLFVSNCTFSNAAATNIFLLNFNPYVDTSVQVSRFTNMALVQDVPVEYQDDWDTCGISVGAWATPGFHYGKVIVDGITFTRHSGRPKMAFRSQSDVDSWVINNARITFENTTAKNDFYPALRFGDDYTLLPTKIAIKNLDIVADVTRSADAYQNISVFSLQGEDVYLDFSGINIDYTLHDITAGGMQLVHLVYAPAVASHFSGVLDRINFKNLTGFPDLGSSQGITMDDGIDLDPTFRIQNSYFGEFTGNMIPFYSVNPDMYLKTSRSGNYPDTGFLQALEISEIPSNNDGAMSFMEDFLMMPANNPYKFFSTGAMASANQVHSSEESVSAVGVAYVYSVAAEDSGFNFTGQETTNNAYGWYISNGYFDTLRLRTKFGVGGNNNFRALVGAIRTETNEDILSKLIGVFFWCAQRDDVDADGVVGDVDGDSTCGEGGEDADDCNWYAVVMTDTDGTSDDDTTLGNNTNTELMNTGVECFPTGFSNSAMQRLAIIPHQYDMVFQIEGVTVATSTTVPGNYMMPYFGTWFQSLDTPLNGHLLDYISWTGSRRLR